MAKHLSELRAFPVFWYGQTYMLGVEAWLAAPLMAVVGASVTALKLPLLAMNVAIALLLFRGFIATTGLDEARAAFATLFFVLAAPITAAHFLTANGGNVEPCLYVLLLWILRRRPIWFGLVLGVGFLNREFTIYGAAALLLLDAVATDALHARRAAALRRRVRHRGRCLDRVPRPAPLLVGRRAGHLDGRPRRPARGATTCCRSPSGCVSIRARSPRRRPRSSPSHWPELFGLEPQPLTDFGIESAVRQGLTGARGCSCRSLGIPLVARASRSRPERR